MDEATIKQGLKILAKQDPDIRRALKQIGQPPPRIRPIGFETFLATIVGQQLSTKAAHAILTRVLALMGSSTPQALLALSDEQLRAAGLSYRKIEYIKGLANAINEGSFNANKLADMSDQEAINAITRLRGLGRWSAEIYLMFSLQRQDIFPADDLALLVALGKLKGLGDKPTPAQARMLVMHWAPWRSVGSLFLWHYYHATPLVGR